MSSNIHFSKLFPFSAYFLSNMILQCMTMYLWWEKPVWLWCQCCIKSNIAANTKNPGFSRNHEKSFYRIYCRVFIITVLTPTSILSPKILEEQNCQLQKNIDFWKELRTISSSKYLVAIWKILALNLLIYTYLHCVRSFLWCATTLDTLN